MSSLPIRNSGLDLMRTLAIAGVLLAHGTDAYLKGHIPIIFTAFTGWLGFIGVEMFFALSGFLVGGIAIKSLEKFTTFKSVRHFWIMRWYRTLPNYYFYLIIHAILASSILNSFSILANNKLYIVFLQSLAWAHPGFFPEAWSLAIEEWFYIILPLGIWALSFLKINKKSAFIYTTALILITPIGLRLWLWNFYPDLPMEIERKSVVMRIDAIMYGVMVAYISLKRNDLFEKIKWPALAISGLLLITIFGYQFSGRAGDIDHNPTFKFTALLLAPLASACAIPFLAGIKFKQSGIPKITLEFIAKISYSLYLCNLLAIEFVKSHFTTANTSVSQSIFLFSIFILSCTLMAFTSYTLIEKPFLKWRDKKYAHP
jgi:peptidoglycan/LPS O-acetylase OafA/YrhL